MMHYYVYAYPYPFYYNVPNYPNERFFQYEHDEQLQENGNFRITDHGPHPYVLNIKEAAKSNTTYRTAIWTGEHLQVTLMSINVGDDIGTEIHPDTDQFLRIEQGQGIVRMGKNSNNLNFERRVNDDS